MRKFIFVLCLAGMIALGYAADDGYGSDVGYGSDIGYGDVGYSDKNDDQQGSGSPLGMLSFGNMGLSSSADDAPGKTSFIFGGIGSGIIENAYGDLLYSGASFLFGWQRIYRQGIFTPVLDLSLNMNLLSHEYYNDEQFFDMGLDVTGIARFNISKFFLEIGVALGLAMGGPSDDDSSAGVESGVEIGIGGRFSKWIVGYRMIVYMSNPWSSSIMHGAGQFYVGF